jgi:hypothetical protein
MQAWMTMVCHVYMWEYGIWPKLIRNITWSCGTLQLIRYHQYSSQGNNLLPLCVVASILLDYWGSKVGDAKNWRLMPGHTCGLRVRAPMMWDMFGIMKDAGPLSGQAPWSLQLRFKQGRYKPRCPCDAMCTCGIWHLAYINAQYHLVMSLVSNRDTHHPNFSQGKHPLPMLCYLCLRFGWVRDA